MDAQHSAGAAMAASGADAARPRKMRLLPVPVRVPGWNERIARWAAA